MAKQKTIIKTKIYLNPYLKKFWTSRYFLSAAMGDTVLLCIDNYLRSVEFDREKLALQCEDLYKEKKVHYIEVTHPARQSREDQSKALIYHVELPKVLRDKIESIIKNTFYELFLLEVTAKAHRAEINVAVQDFLAKYKITEDDYALDSALRQYQRLREADLKKSKKLFA